MILNNEGLFLHPAYSSSPWSDLNSLSQIIPLGLAAENYENPILLTCCATDAFRNHVIETGISPSVFVNKRFSDLRLGHLRRVGVFEYGPKTKGHFQNRFRCEAMDRLHAHFIVDCPHWDAGLKKRFEACFRLNHDDPPAHGGKVIFKSQLTFEIKTPPSDIYGLAEWGCVGWLVYAALGAKRTMDFLRPGRPAHARTERRSSVFRDYISSRLTLSELHFPELIFFDRQTGRRAREIHADPATPALLIQRAREIADAVAEARQILRSKARTTEPPLAPPAWHCPQDESWKAQYGL